MAMSFRRRESVTTEDSVPTKKGKTLRSCPFNSHPQEDVRLAWLVFNPGRIAISKLERYDIFCLWTFRAFSNSEFNFLPFVQSFKPRV
jgi:hypothetical protein